MLTEAGLIYCMEPKIETQK